PSAWQNFLEAAGLQKPIALQYGTLFAENRIRTNMLPDLTKEVLKEMGIRAIGDIMLILNHCKQQYLSQVVAWLGVLVIVHVLETVPLFVC
ncbi:unnamed protein product, partial [Soboliphyme baturini]|uniref:SAM domain-containing protein n=1 Tax=Soboliphyme baturini TaxID=241478 RepID=A0A183IQR2_9BILA